MSAAKVAVETPPAPDRGQDQSRTWIAQTREPVRGGIARMAQAPRIRPPSGAVQLGQRRQAFLGGPNRTTRTRAGQVQFLPQSRIVESRPRARRRESTGSTPRPGTSDMDRLACIEIERVEGHQEDRGRRIRPCGRMAMRADGIDGQATKACRSTTEGRPGRRPEPTSITNQSGSRDVSIPGDHRRRAGASMARRSAGPTRSTYFGQAAGKSYPA